MSKKNATEQLRRCVAKDILKGATQIKLIQKINKDAYGLGIKLPKDSAENLISKTRKELREDWIEERKGLQEIQLQRLMDLYEESREANDRYSALNTMKEINKMVGLYEAEKIKVDASINGSIEIDFGFSEDNSEE